METSIRYKLNTRALPDGNIAQELQQIIGNQIETLSRWVMNTRDEGIRQALIDLGWTPPADESTGAWKEISSAPRDGRVVEIRSSYGIAPYYCLCSWMQLVEGLEDRGWVHVADKSLSEVDGPHLAWREYRGRVEDYVDPTNGAQVTQAYWLRNAEQRSSD